MSIGELVGGPKKNPSTVFISGLHVLGQGIPLKYLLSLSCPLKSHSSPRSSDSTVCIIKSFIEFDV